MLIRPFVSADIRPVANLYEALMRSGADLAPNGLVDAFRHLFIDTPAFRPDIPSLVTELDGKVVGFQGVQVREFEFAGSRRTLAALGPVFVVPELRSRAAGAMLIKAAMKGSQDLSISDGAPADSCRLWEQLGGTLAVPQSMEWTVPLRPAQLAAHRLSSRYKDYRRLAGYAAMPLCVVVDRLIALRWNKSVLKPPVQPPEAVPLSPSRLSQLAEELDPGFRLRMLYPPPMAEWIFKQLHAYSCRGELVAQELIDPRGPVGWFIAYAGSDRVFRVMQVHASTRNLPRVVAAVIDEAHRRGMHAVRGRIDGRITSALSPYRVRFALGNRVLVDAKDRALLDAVLSLDNSISRVDGEWLMAIRDQPYSVLR